MPRSHRHHIEPSTLWRVILFILILLMAAGVLHAPGPKQVITPGALQVAVPKK